MKSSILTVNIKRQGISATENLLTVSLTSKILHEALIRAKAANIPFDELTNFNVYRPNKTKYAPLLQFALKDAPNKNLPIFIKGRFTFTGYDTYLIGSLLELEKQEKVEITSNLWFFNDDLEALGKAYSLGCNLLWTFLKKKGLTKK